VVVEEKRVELRRQRENIVKEFHDMKKSLKEIFSFENFMKINFVV
jgi:hypothetical protein